MSATRLFELEAKAERLRRIEEAARLFFVEEDRWFRTTEARPFNAPASAQATMDKRKARAALKEALDDQSAPGGDAK